MDDVIIEQSLKKDQIPESAGRTQIKYDKVLKAVATLERDEALEVSVPVKKHHRTSGIKRALKKHFPHAKYKLTTRTNKAAGKTSIYIYKED